LAPSSPLSFAYGILFPPPLIDFIDVFWIIAAASYATSYAALWLPIVDFRLIRTDSRHHDETTPEERRERARLRSERWRRAHGIGPRKPAQRLWLAEGVSRAARQGP
jgi:hypothetical protein